MAHALLKTFTVNDGDCIALLLKEEGNKEYHILVDCGAFKPDVKDFVEKDFCKRIDLLVVTHIDKDHIAGLIEMLSKIPDLTIGKILYNCYQRQPNEGEELDEKTKAILHEYCKDLPIVIDSLDYKISAKQSLTLAETILGNAKWRKESVWERACITESTDDFALEDNANTNYGKLVFLSPSREVLDKLDKEYRKLFFDMLFKERETDYKDEESIYELLMRFAEMKENNQEIEAEYISGETITQETLKAKANINKDDIKPSNEASIAFIWECREAKILFLGDSRHVQIVNALERKYKDVSKPIIFKAIKVSHHGSIYNTSQDLLKWIDSEHFFFTGGNDTNKPSIETIAKIITRPLSENIKERILHFNHTNYVTDDVENISKDMKEQLHFTVDVTDNCYEFDY